MLKIALVGRPNVGKSSMFNRFAKTRDAITSDVAGTTRDVKRRVVEIEGREALLFDTGGIEDRDEIFTRVRVRSLAAAAEADMILYMVDGRAAPDPEDRKLFYELQGHGVPVALVLNKIDNEKMEEQAWEYAEFGAETLFSVSVSHGRGMRELTDWIVSHLQQAESPGGEETFDDFLDNFDDSGELVTPATLSTEDGEIHIAIIGRPNVGKSSLLNALLGEERSVVSPIAGTTIDPVDETIDHEGRKITFVDTAGVRRRSKILGIEKLALNRTEKMLERADIALVVLDVSEPFTELDERIAGLADKFGLAVIIVLNKYDIACEEYDALEEQVRRKFVFLSHAPMITVSAESKKRIHKLWELIFRTYENYTRRIPTGKLNELIKEAMIRHHPPSDKGKAVKIYFATQFDIKPPRVALVSNRPRALHFSYLRYLANRIREVMDLSGSPLVLIPRKKGEKDEGEEEE